MSKNYENEIKQMQRLIDYGTKKEVNENRNNNSVVEYQTKGADGRTYGIVRECSKYYIKVAPQKDTAVLTEDFDYIGGFNNKRFNEYDNYTKASKQLDLKLKAINESMGVNTPTTQFVETPSAEWQINETKEMRNEINRFHELVSNVDKLLKENNHMTSTHTIPEAPGKAKVTDKDVSTPFEVPATAKGDKEVKNGTVNYQKSGPFETNPKLDMQSDKKPTTPGDNGIPFEKKPSFGPKFDTNGSVATKNPSGGKVTRADENVSRTIKLTEEQVLAWSRNKDYMDKSHGTEIGHSGDPFEEEVNAEKENDRNINTEYKMTEGVAAHITDNQNVPKAGTGKPRNYQSPFDDDVTEAVDDKNDSQMLLDSDYSEDAIGDTDFDGVESFDDDFDGEDEFDLELDDKLPDEDVIDDDDVNFVDDSDFDDDMESDDDFVDDRDFEDDDFDDDMEPDDSQFYNNDGLKGLDLDDDFDNFDDDFVDDYPGFDESRSRRRSRRMNENLVLNDFGKHPAYQKEVMSLPPNKEIERWGRDWNDKSAKGDEPYGRTIGSSAPYTEDIIDKITDMVINRLSPKKKV